jgi:hypothetical protein
VTSVYVIYKSWDFGEGFYGTREEVICAVSDESKLRETLQKLDEWADSVYHEQELLGVNINFYYKECILDELPPGLKRIKEESVDGKKE